MSREELQLEKELEKELERSLRRRPAPTGLADAVLRRVQEAQAHSVAPGPGLWVSKRLESLALVAVRLVPRLAVPGVMRGLAAALLLMLLLPVGGFLYRRHRQAQAEAAAEQFTLAMRLTQAALVDAAEHLREYRFSRGAE